MKHTNCILKKTVTAKWPSSQQNELKNNNNSNVCDTLASLAEPEMGMTQWPAVWHRYRVKSYTTYISLAMIIYIFLPRFTKKDHL